MFVLWNYDKLSNQPGEVRWFLHSTEKSENFSLEGTMQVKHLHGSSCSKIFKNFK